MLETALSSSRNTTARLLGSLRVKQESCFLRECFGNIFLLKINETQDRNGLFLFLAVRCLDGTYLDFQWLSSNNAKAGRTGTVLSSFLY